MIDGTATLRGLTIGAGTVYELTGWPDGLLSTPGIRESDEDRPQAHGVIAGDDFYSTLRVSFNVQVNAGSRAESEAALSLLNAAFKRSTSDLWLDVRVAGSPAEYTLRGRPRGVAVGIDRRRFISGLIDARCSFVATDPIKYGPLETVVVTMDAVGGGLMYPVTYPITYGGSDGVGIGSAVNDGTEAVDWTAELAGPLTNPRIEHVESGRFIKLTATIEDGQTVLLDSATAGILLGGTASRSQWQAPGSKWFQLDAGANSLRFSADTGTGTATIRYRPGWA